MSKLIVLSGVPGCGKSTWANEFIAENSAIVVSRDEIRFSLLKEGEDYFSHEDEVTATFYDKINKYLALKAYDYVIADATHNTVKARNYMLDHINMDNVEQIIVVNFYISIDQCMKQNRQRTGRARVPDYALERMYKFHQVPTFHEKYKYGCILNIPKEDD